MKYTDDNQINEIFSIIQTSINGKFAENTDNNIITDTLNNYFCEETNDKESKEKLKQVIYKLKELRIDMCQFVMEELSNGNGRDMIEDIDNDILIYISKLNDAIDECEKYLYETLEEKEEDLFKEDCDFITSKPKIAIFSNAAINELKAVPDEEKASFSVPLEYIKNGGARLNFGVKTLNSIGGNRDVLEYKNPVGQARIFAYKITKNIIYVVTMMLKKDDWPKLLRKSLIEKKPTEEYKTKIKKSLETKEGYEELQKISKTQMEEVESIIGNNQKEEDKTEKKLEARWQDAISTINTLLGTTISLDDFKDKNATVENSIFERIYNILEECISIEGDIASTIYKYQTIKQIEKIIIENIKETLKEKTLLNETEKIILNLKVENSLEIKDEEHQELGEMNREILIAERRIIYMLNYLKENLEELRILEKDIVLTR